jgi:hypothetical protein
MSWWRTVRRAPARQNQLDALKTATRLGELMSGQRLLVIRAIDDEASLTLALSAILNYFTARFIIYALLVYFALLAVAFLSIAFDFLIGPFYLILLIGLLASTMMLFGLLSVARTAHGRELAVSPMECQINTQSTPDAKSLSQIITLVRQTYVRSLRHGIYDHEDCAKTISDWVRSHGGNSPVR